MIFMQRCTMTAIIENGIRPICFTFYFLGLLFTVIAAHSSKLREEGSCDASGNCRKSCRLAEHLCKPKSLYESGGTAMHFKKDQPESTTVCETEKYKDSAHRVATWMFSRSTRTDPPKIILKTNIFTCDKETDDSSCCCEPLTAIGQVEIWQARPDGTYPRLSDKNDGDCRTRMTTSGSSLVFETVAPGSVGAMGGLAPFGDVMPFGAPVIHILVSSPGHSPALFDLPVIVSSGKTTLEQGRFRGPDLRGVAWVKEGKESPYEVVSWKGHKLSNSVEMEIDIFLAKSNNHYAPDFCPSLLYGLPSSFFLEPISICAPSMLDFFKL